DHDDGKSPVFGRDRKEYDKQDPECHQNIREGIAFPNRIFDIDLFRYHSHDCLPPLSVDDVCAGCAAPGASFPADPLSPRAPSLPSRPSRPAAPPAAAGAAAPEPPFAVEVAAEDALAALPP